jgi:hypothetical protein
MNTSTICHIKCAYIGGTVLIYGYILYIIRTVNLTFCSLLWAGYNTQDTVCNSLYAYHMTEAVSGIPCQTCRHPVGHMLFTSWRLHREPNMKGQAALAPVVAPPPIKEKTTEENPIVLRVVWPPPLETLTMTDTPNVASVVAPPAQATHADSELHAQEIECRVLMWTTTKPPFLLPLENTRNMLSTHDCNV